MRSQIKRVRQPLTDDELESESVQKHETGGNDLNEMLAEISLKNVPLEERRKEAKKPLYLVRYE